MSTDIERFMALFSGNKRTHGVFAPTPNGGGVKGNLYTEHKEYTIEDVEKHLNGEVGLGTVPILDDGKAWYGALDIDAHGDAEDIDLFELEKKVRAADYPLTVCRSKSGGAHLYLFGTEPLNADLMRSMLSRWSVRLGYGGCEVFPKQSKLAVDKDGTRQNGNWINLAWFDAYSDDSLRYCVEGGKRIDFHHFLDIAESRRITPAMMVEIAEGEHRDAPPCLQKLIADGIPSGGRNEALYNMVIYLKKAFPETYREKAFDMNATLMDEPLSHSEAKKVINSSSRRDYKYRCGVEPCKSLCKSFECVNRKYGISPDEKSEMDMGVQPQFDRLEKHTTTPVRWVLYVDGVPLNLTTPQLMDFRAIREAVADNLTRLIPPMKNDRWQIQLHTLMTTAMLVEAPEEATLEGMLWNKLIEFLQRTDLKAGGTDTKDREQLMYGTPVVQEVEGEKRVYFRGSDFMAFLTKQRQNDVKGPAVWMLLRQHGCQHGKLRVEGSPINVWWVPLADVDNDEPELKPMEVRSEF